MTLMFFILFSSGLFKFMFNFKYILISLLSLEVMGFSIFMLMYTNFFFNTSFYMLVYMCLLVSGSVMGLTLLVIFSMGNSVNNLSSLKMVMN